MSSLAAIIWCPETVNLPPNGRNRLSLPHDSHAMGPKENLQPSFKTKPNNVSNPKAL